MNENEIQTVIAKLSSNWGRWSDEAVSEWWDNLRVLHCSVDDAMSATQSLVDTEHYRPAFADVRAEALRFRRDREQHEAEAKALAAPRTDRDRERAAGRVGVAKVRAVVAGMPTFGDVNNTRGHDHRSGSATCRVCSGHDHTDRRTIGHAVAVQWHDGQNGRVRVENHEPIPAWHLSCPRCAPTTDLDLVCDNWTPVGAQMMRDRGHTRQVPADETF